MKRPKFKAKCLDCNVKINAIQQIAIHHRWYQLHRIEVTDASEYDRFGFPLDSAARRMKSDIF